jgi:hypothetical protein
MNVLDVQSQHRWSEIRERYREVKDDTGHVFVVTWDRGDDTTDLIVWRTFEGMVRCIARMEQFEHHDIKSVHVVRIQDIEEDV